jgi:uncharacterized protein (TIGR02145 family)
MNFSLYKLDKLHTMKKHFTILAAALLTATLWAQSPEKMSYQAIIRDANDDLVTNTKVGMRIHILHTSEFGAAVYVETHSPTTNANGLVNVEIGAGTVVSGDFKTIDWAKGPYFIKTETDPAGGKKYSITGTSQLLSVPYALHAKTADNGITTAQANAIEANTAKVSAATGTKTGEMQYWNGTKWITVAAGNEGQVLTFRGGVPTWSSAAITIAGPTDAYNPTTNKVWMDRNLGASQVAISSSDTNAYGDLYQWGRRTDGHEKRTSGTTSTLSTTNTPGHDNFITSENSPYDWRSTKNDNLWQGVSGTNNPCPTGYRLPTEAEWEAEYKSWSSQDADGAFASPLKLPVAGNRSHAFGSLHSVGSYGSYWSSTVDGPYSRGLIFLSGGAGMESGYRANGISVRCIKE